MRFPANRRRQVDILRPRQNTHGVNIGALGQSTEGDEDLRVSHLSEQERQIHFAQKCAQQDLL